jgi:hypothetical protein
MWMQAATALLLALAVVQPLQAADFLYTWPPSSASGLLGYDVYQSTDGGPYQLIAQVPAGTLPDPQHPSYWVTGLQQGTTYHFASSATATSGNSPLSYQTCITINTDVIACDPDDDGGTTVFISCFIAASALGR